MRRSSTNSGYSFSLRFQVGAKASENVALPELLSSLSTLPGFYAQPSRVWGAEQFFQVSLRAFVSVPGLTLLKIQSAAISWFNDQLCVVITGELDPVEECWIARFEFRASSHSTLLVFRPFVHDWIRLHTKNAMTILDGELLPILLLVVTISHLPR